MNKQKFGKKDIFAPATKTKEADGRKIEGSTEMLHRPKRVKRISKANPVQEDRPVEPQRMIIHSFRIREDLVEGLREYAFFEKTKIYKVINRIVEDFLRNYKEKRTYVLRES